MSKFKVGDKVMFLGESRESPNKYGSCHFSENTIVKIVDNEETIDRYYAVSGIMPNWMGGIMIDNQFVRESSLRQLTELEQLLYT